jgi:disulfide bond formation protein DsbB
MGIFKLALLSIGVAIGAYWNEFFRGYSIALIIIALIMSAYIAYISLKQTVLKS